MSLTNVLNNFESGVSEHLKYIIVIILRKIIENENKNEDVIQESTPLFKWDGDDWNVYATHI